MFNDAIDALLYDDSCVRTCTVIYEGSKVQACTNCNYDPIGRKSSNKWKSGGPLPFPNGTLCPQCGGTGKKMSQSTEDIDLMVIWDSNGWLQGTGSGKNTHTANTGAQTIQTLCASTLFPKITRANELLVDSGIQGYVKLRYRRMGDPEPCGFGSSRYILTTWEKVN